MVTEQVSISENSDIESEKYIQKNIQNAKESFQDSDIISKKVLEWINIMLTLDYEIPTIGNTINLLKQHNIINENSYINFSQYNKNMPNWLIPNLISSVENDNFGYPKELMPDSEFVKIHSPHTHMMLAAKPEWYGPIYAISDIEIDNIDNYFWAECGWRMKIVGARPCNAESNNFDQEEVINYFNDFGPYFSAIKNNIKKATPITKEKITESMILYENHKQNL